MTTSVSGLITSFSKLSFLSDSPKSPYRYRPLKGDQIRLLRLLPPTRQKGYLHTEFVECELVHVSLEDPGQFEALSYVWGPPDRTKTIQIRTGKPQLRVKVLGVTDSLFTALQNLRYASKTRILWIDQLCNNQDDKKEMNAQVKRMGDIYRQSSCTVIWLG
ncbi:HET-domain-containing protein, partial [Melanomma pulvis-pyrius CBS 109.77]